MKARSFLPILLSLLTVTAAACGPQPAEVRVLHANSLTPFLEGEFIRGWAKEQGLHVRAEGFGSVTCVRFVREGLKHPDILFLADALLFEKDGGDRTETPWAWWLAFVENRMVVSFRKGGRVAERIDRDPSLAGRWWDLVLDQELRFGRDDPELDPRGYRALFVLDLASRIGAPRDLRARVLARPDAARSVFMGNDLMFRVETGQIDLAITYASEAASHGLRFFEIAPEASLGDPEHAADYGRASYDFKDGGRAVGSVIRYGVSIPREAGNPEGAARLLAWLIGPEGRGALRAAGFGAADPEQRGDVSQIPPRLRQTLKEVVHEK